MAKTLAVVQSSYIPWKGYFDLINAVDEFVLYDDVQYTVRDWRNRNIIKTQHGLKWLTIPVEAGSRSRRIQDVVISDARWAAEHWNVIRHSYARAAAFESVGTWLEHLYCNATSRSLSEINYYFLSAICTRLGIPTRLTWSTQYAAIGSKTARLVSICQAAGATKYVSGPAGRTYMQPELFEAAGITLEYFDYEGYPEYRQCHPPFEHRVSVIDLLLNEGEAAARFLKTCPSCESR